MTKDLSETIESIKFSTKVESYPILSGLMSEPCYKGVLT